MFTKFSFYVRAKKKENVSGARLNYAIFLFKEPICSNNLVVNSICVEKIYKMKITQSGYPYHILGMYAPHRIYHVTIVWELVFS